MNKKAIVTLVIGCRYQELFTKWFRPDWERYCSRYSLDLIVIDKPLDDSPRARSRSPAWQKCIIHRSPEVSQHDQVAWVDADIRIRPDAPNIFAELPEESIGAVNAYATPTKEDHDIALRRLYEQWDKAGISYVSNLTAPEYHAQFGLELAYDGAVQTGVIVFSPRLHRDIFQKTYECYEEKGDSSWNYEMRPLSYEILKSGSICWLSPKFNLPWDFYAGIVYPFLKVRPGRIDALLGRLTFNLTSGLRCKCVEAVFRHNYFLHFAGGSKDYKLLPVVTGC